MDFRYLAYINPEKKYYSPLDERQKKSRFNLNGLNENWQIEEDANWIYIMNKTKKLPKQGWKIHVSATLEDAQESLNLVASYLIHEAVSFKYASSLWELSMKNSKYGDRGSSGKFITIYPIDTAEFQKLIQELEIILKDRPKGAYILTDKRWKKSNVYFRYGGILPMEIKRGNLSIPAIEDEKGVLIPDKREPIYHVPEFVKEPNLVKAMTEEMVLKENEEDMTEFNKYEFLEALHFSNGGGVYKAKDLENGTTVIVKEGRPEAGIDALGIDGYGRIQKEAEIMKKFGTVEQVTHYINDFTAWENRFLVEEFIEGMALDDWLPIAFPFSESEDKEKYGNNAIKILDNILLGLEAVHTVSVGIGDFSPANIMINPESFEIKFIDFELAGILKEPYIPGLMTMGFATSETETREESDWFALKRLSFYMFMPVGPIFDLSENMMDKYIEYIKLHFGEQVASKIKEIEKICNKKIGRELKVGKMFSVPKSLLTPDNIDEYISKIRAGLVNDLKNTEIYKTEQLIQGDIRQYEKDGAMLSPLYGGFGNIMALSRTGELPAIAKEWAIEYSSVKMLEKHLVDDGLFTGKAGIASIVYDLGLIEESKAIFNSIQYQNIKTDLSIASGLAGIGLAFITASTLPHFEFLRERSISIADTLMREFEANAPIYPYDEDSIALGLTDGWAGVSLFLATMYQITKNKIYLSSAIEIITYEVNHNTICEETDSTRQGNDREGNRKIPYLSGGSVGIALVLLEIEKLLVNDSNPWKLEIEEISRVIDSYCFYCSGLFRGATGMVVLANALDFEKNDLDLPKVTNALRILDNYILEKDGDYYLTGDFDYKISADLFSGASGALLALYDTAHLFENENWGSWMPISQNSKIQVFNAKK
ncbi:Serine/threonine protein kinase [Carnobacterium maltaromaticum]|uniref:class III lanthionine synthetase LanKC n=1 Tax=Carnobacterium maltaromaticum TaxID=2751 RepID=UPI00191BC918|nr:class III lanthionine synthetase LanKC [Carnobacterium maltaromaticum]CAD5901011.1 Serine/threonine protein kinase [Carnobacterium maltaromaticum]